MQLPRNAAQRRFAAVWGLSAFVKLAALAVFLFLVLDLTGVAKP